MWQLRRPWRALVSLCLFFPSEASGSILSGPSSLEGTWLVRSLSLVYSASAFLSLLEYESEKFPQGLKQGQKMAVSLRPPSEDHWNIASDLVLPLTLDTSRQRREAKGAAQGLEGKSEGAKVSPTGAPAPRESPQIEAGGSEALPKRTALHRERVLETMHEILAHVHALRVQTMHEMGSVRSWTEL